MVDIVYDRKKLKVTVKGHAQSGEAGHDLVCAAASILVYTLASNVVQLSADKKHIRRPKIDIKEGNATVSCSAVHGMTALATIMFDAICSGFDILQQQYPEYINYKIIEG